MARQIDKPFEREAALVHVIKHDRHQSLDTGHARRRFRIRLGLFLERMGRMVGAQHVDDARKQSPPDRVAMMHIAHRRIHLGAGTQTLIGIRG